MYVSPAFTLIVDSLHVYLINSVSFKGNIAVCSSLIERDEKLDLVALMKEHCTSPPTVSLVHWGVKSKFDLCGFKSSEYFWDHDYPHNFYFDFSHPNRVYFYLKACCKI